MTAERILILDDDVIVAEIARSIISNAGYLPVVANNSPILAAQSLHKFDALLLDLWLSDGFFEDSLNALARAEYKGGVILISGLESECLYDAAQFAVNLDLNLLGYMSKPLRADMLLNTLERLKTRA